MLIDDLLTLSRLGRTETRFLPFDMTALANDIVHDLNHDSTNKVVDIRIQPLGMVYGDRILIRQALLNLISNAMKFSSKRTAPVVEIASRVEGNEVILSVKDNGVGFDMKYSNKLFGVFQRLHHEDEFEGTGVGLAIVQRVVYRHGGRIWADSKVDEAASFFFALPRR